MTVPEFPSHDPRPDRSGRAPRTGMDPMPSSTPLPPLGDTVPDPAAPGRDPRRPTPGDPAPDGRLELVATGRDDRRRHVVDVTSGELGDPTGLRARCGAPVEQVVPGLRAEQADCPGCTLAVHR